MFRLLTLPQIRQNCTSVRLSTNKSMPVAQASILIMPHHGASSGKKALIFQGARMASQAMSEEDFAMFLFELCTLWCGQKPSLNCKWIAMTCTLERRLTFVDALRSQRLGARLLAFPLCSAHTRDCEWLWYVAVQHANGPETEDLS